MQTHRDLCHLVSTWLLSQQTIKYVCWELRLGRGVVDAIGVDPRGKRIVVCECKRTRADLLADLRAGKMFKYESSSSHCYLAGTAEALGDDPLNDLTARGLPSHWGVLLLNTSVTCIRSAKSHRKVQERTVLKTIALIGKSHMWRHMKLMGLIDKS